MSHLLQLRRAVAAGLATAGLVCAATSVTPTVDAHAAGCGVDDVFDFQLTDTAYESDSVGYSARAVVGCLDPGTTYTYSLQIWEVDGDGSVHSLVDQAPSGRGVGSFNASGSLPLGHRVLGGNIQASFVAPTGHGRKATGIFSCEPTAGYVLDEGSGYLGSRVTGHVTAEKPAPTCPEPAVLGWRMHGTDPRLPDQVDLAAGGDPEIDFQPTRLYGAAPDFGYVLNVDVANGYGEHATGVHTVRQFDHAPQIVEVRRTAPRELVASVSDADAQDTVSYRWWLDGHEDETTHGPRLDLTTVAPGNHDVRLVVTDIWGVSSTWNASITVAVNPVHAIVVLASPDDGSAAPRVVSYDASGSSGSPSRYHWSFDDGTTADTIRPTVIKTWTMPCRTASGTLTATDAAGDVDTTTLPSVVVGGRLAVLTPPPYAVVGRAATMRGSTTDCTGADPTTGGQYRWDFGDGATATGRTASHVWAAAGDYPVIMTWRSGKQVATVSRTVHVTLAHADLTSSAAFCFGSCTVRLGLARSFGAVVGGAPLPLATWTLDFGDGSVARTGTGPVPATAVRHTYAAGRSYHPTLTVTDTGGNTDTATLVIVMMGG